LAGSTETGFEIENISCRDLSSIDRLWVERSDGTFGFSVQKTILDEFASQPGHYDNDANWDGFYEKIGWVDGGKGGILNPGTAIGGHLPRRVWGIEMDIFSLVLTCRL